MSYWTRANLLKILIFVFGTSVAFKVETTLEEGDK